MVDVTGSIVQHMYGGLAAVSGLPQINTVTVGGTFEVGDRFTVTFGTGTARRRYGARGNPTPPGEFALTFKSKVYVISDSILFFPAVDDPLSWNTDDTGAGFINMANQAAGSDILISLASYFDRLAVFSRRAVQVWFVDVDETGNTQLQVLNNTGALAAHSVVPFGDTDVFYLSDSGIRSLQARDSSNSASVSDVGNSIDDLVQPHLRALTDAQKAAALGIIEPIDGRYWLILDETIYVFTFFPSSKISAWSTYELGFAPTEIVTKQDGVYLRSGDTIYLYGGDDGNTFDSSEVTVTIPFLDSQDPAAIKEWYGLDVACEGVWTVKIGFNPNDATDIETAAIVTESTFPDEKVVVYGRSSHAFVQMTHAAPGAAKIAGMALHYDKINTG